MRMIVVLETDDIIDGVLRVAGQVVTVDDGYTNYRRILRKLADEADQNVRGFFNAGLRKLQAILQFDYPQFWAALQKKPKVQDAIIQQLREQPDYLRRALNEPDWFVKVVTEKLGA